MDCIDTHVLIWKIGGLARVARGQEGMVERAKRYIEHAQREKLDIMVPTPVLAEYWVGASMQERHEKEVFEIATRIAPFDAPAAIIAAEMFRDKNKLNELTNRFQIGYDCIKIDIMIAAIAIANKASRLVTHDKDLYNEIVQNRLVVVDLPDFGPREQQGRLYEAP